MLASTVTTIATCYGSRGSHFDRPTDFDCFRLCLRHLLPELNCTNGAARSRACLKP